MGLSIKGFEYVDGSSEWMPILVESILKEGEFTSHYIVILFQKSKENKGDTYILHFSCKAIMFSYFMQLLNHFLPITKNCSKCVLLARIETCVFVQAHMQARFHVQH